jgi:glutamate carboxypeptidase
MASPAQAARDWLQGSLPRMEEVLRPLVEQNSYTENAAGGRAVGKLLVDLFRIEGLSAEVVPSSRYADHLVFRSSGDAARAPVALLGHLDTVFPPGAFEGYRVDGALRRGPGVLDMKGGLVAIAFALKAIAETGGLHRIAPLRVVIVADEEVGSPEGRPLIEKSIRGSGAALVFESGRANDAIVTRRKGTGGMTARAQGKAAHAGNNYADGANAIWAMARFIDAAQRLTDLPHGLSVNVGQVEGGEAKNTVPDACRSELDLRFETRPDADKLIQSLEAVAAEAARGVPGTKLEVALNSLRLPMEASDASLALMKAYGACASAVGLGAIESPRVGGGSDGCTSSAMGIPSIDALGPRGKGFHTKDEYIEAETLVSRAQALAMHLLGGP